LIAGVDRRFQKAPENGSSQIRHFRKSQAIIIYFLTYINIIYINIKTI